jgi:hypothetical protein
VVRDLGTSLERGKPRDLAGRVPGVPLAMWRGATRRGPRREGGLSSKAK